MVRFEADDPVIRTRQCAIGPVGPGIDDDDDGGSGRGVREESAGS
jgi:hypothetical protein